MKILLIGDVEPPDLWARWTDRSAEKYADIDVIVSVGDLNPLYLEFIVTMLNKPLLYVRGNHDNKYDERPPEGCMSLEDISYEIPDPAVPAKIVRFTGLGGSVRYRKGTDMYTEEEMEKRIKKVWWKIWLSRLKRSNKEKEIVDIFVSHAPCRGYGDMDDLPHQGFKCFNDLLMKWKPDYHCHGHIHMDYSRKTVRELVHESGTKLINGCGVYTIEV